MQTANLLAPLFLVAAFVAPASATQSFHEKTLSPARAERFTRIDAPGAGTGPGQGTIVYGINSAGVTVGEYINQYNISRAFIRAPDGTFTILKHQGAAAFAIDDTGSVAGEYFDKKLFAFRGFLLTLAGKFKTFDCSGSGQCDPNNLAISKGIITGYYMEGSGYQSFYRLKDGTVTQFGASGAAQTQARGINSTGVISGTWTDSSYVNHGFVRSVDGTFTEFDAPDASGLGTFAGQINKQGWVDGSYSDSSNVIHAFLRDPVGNFTEFDAPDGTNGTGGTGGINRRITAAGVYTDASTVQHGYMRRKNGVIDEFDPPDSTWTDAWDINDSDFIVGDFIDSGGAHHGYPRRP